MFVCCECCVLSGRGLCDELITRPEESYRLWCVIVCDLENLKNEEAMTRVGSQRHRRKKNTFVEYCENAVSATISHCGEVDGIINYHELLDFRRRKTSNFVM